MILTASRSEVSRTVEPGQGCHMGDPAHHPGATPDGD